MNSLLYVKCWLLEGVSQRTGEIYYRFTTKFNRPVSVSGLTLGNTSYSKLVTGQNAQSSAIHTVFCNDMNEQMFNDALAMNGGSDEFYMGIPSKDSESLQILTQQEYRDVQAQTNATEQATVVD
tara:strand:- start:569 stop:940 length:372 start_codon:yes stop_codon:yes gene_type:complete